MREGRLRARLRRLEESVPPPDPGVPAWELAAAEELVGTLGAEHGQRLQDEVDALGAWDEAPPDTPRPETPLYDELQRRLRYHDPELEGRKGPLALPPAVAEVYLSEPEARYLYHRCEDCAYAVPAIWQYPGQHPVDSPRWRVFFPRCPLCGGPTGYCT